MKLTSPAFSSGKPLPVEHTADGDDTSPPLHWTHAPEGTRSFALVCHDPDAPSGDWTHWVLYGIPGATTSLPPDMPGSDTLPDGARQGLNDFGRIGYGGASPPPGSPHRYIFMLYALDVALSLHSRASRAELLGAIRGHILATAEFVGTYQRLR